MEGRSPLYWWPDLDADEADELEEQGELPEPMMIMMDRELGLFRRVVSVAPGVYEWADEDDRDVIDAQESFYDEEES